MIPEPYGDSFIESALITEVSFVTLQLEQLGEISQDMELKVDGNDYFILENQNSQCVYHFNEKGELLNKICEQKSASGGSDVNLSNPVKFTVNPYKKQVEIYNFEDAQISRFNYNGTLESKINLTINPSDFIRDIDGNYWLYMGWHNSETQYRLIKADANGKVLESKMRLSTNCMQTEGFAFYPNGEAIYMWELLGNTVYSIEKNQITPKYLYDYGSNNLPLNYHMAKAEDSYRLIQESGYYTLKKYVGNSDFSYMYLNYNSNEQREMFHVIEDKKANQVFVYTENSAIAAFDKAQSISADNELIFLVSPRKIRQLLSTGTEFVPAAFNGLLEEIRRERNTVILKVKLQSFESEVAPAVQESDYFD